MRSKTSRGFLRRILVLTSSVFFSSWYCNSHPQHSHPLWPCDEAHDENLGRTWTDENGAEWICELGMWGIGRHVGPLG